LSLGGFRQEMTAAIISILIPLAAFGAIGWRSAHFALRESPLMSRTKVAFDGVLLLGCLAAAAGIRWLTGPEDLSGFTLLIYPMLALGVVACLSAMTGTLIGLYRQRRGYH
jgi:hypothetical protein